MENYRSRKTYLAMKKFKFIITELQRSIHIREGDIISAQGTQRRLFDAKSEISKALSKVQEAHYKIRTALPKSETTLSKSKAALSEAALSEAEAALSEAETILSKEAQYVLFAAENAHFVAERVYQNFLEETVASLNKELSAAQETFGEKKINAKPRFGIRRKITTFNDIRIEDDFPSPTFRFVGANDKILGYLYTPENVLTIIEMLKAAVERGDNEFDFP